MFKALLVAKTSIGDLTGQRFGALPGGGCREGGVAVRQVQGAGRAPFFLLRRPRRGECNKLVQVWRSVATKRLLMLTLFPLVYGLIVSRFFLVPQPLLAQFICTAVWFWA